MRTNKRGLRVSLTGGSFGGRPVVEAVRPSRTKLMSTLVATTLVIATAPWAASHFDEWTADSKIAPAASSEPIVVLPGSAPATRNGQLIAAATGDELSVQVDFGELSAGSSQPFPDLLRIRNDGRHSALVYVEPSGLSEAPLHASVSGDEAPGAYRVEAGETRSVDVALTADLVSLPGDIAGALKVRSASGRFEHEIPARVTVKPPTLQETIDTLLAPITNPEAGFDKLAELVGGLEAPEFVVDGVADGGAYATDVSISWRPVGPLMSVTASLDGAAIGETATVTEEGEHRLVLEGKALNVAPIRREVGFRIDKTPPAVRIMSPGTAISDRAVLIAQAEDKSRVVGVDFVLQRKPQSDAAPEAPVDVPVDAPVPSPTPSPTSSAAEPQSGEPPIRIPATRDEHTGLWTVTLPLPPGTFTLVAEAVDAVGNRQASAPQTLLVLDSSPGPIG